jgi:hypothetical protein
VPPSCERTYCCLNPTVEEKRKSKIKSGLRSSGMGSRVLEYQRTLKTEAAGSSEMLVLHNRRQGITFQMAVSSHIPPR